ncbi:MAG TPA: DUF3090 family protein [Dehalococcoidia bacterium]|nr:DUF3090 family protein [Dehalococcoidia bacterium]
MERAEHDFGRAQSIDAESVGVPGQRRFRLLVSAGTQSASIWMEKQQLAGIGTWFEEVLEKLDREQPSTEPDVEPAPIGAVYDVEFRASQIGLGYAEEDGLFAIHAFDESGAAGPPAFRCLINRGQSRVLARKIAGVIAGGRQICPLCGAPVDPSGHVCPRSNGHAKALA